MIIDRVDAEPEDLGVALVELRLQARHVAELGGAHRREVLGMREQDGPAIADPIVEVDLALGGLRREVRRFGIDSERHWRLPYCKSADCTSPLEPSPYRNPPGESK